MFPKLDADARQKRFETLAIELEQLKTPDGKHIHLPQVMEMVSLYSQAEAELLDLETRDLDP